MPVTTGTTEYEKEGAGIGDQGSGIVEGAAGRQRPRKTLGLVEGGKEKAGFSEGRWGELTTVD